MTNINNILVHSLVNIGDVLLSTSAVALIKQFYPNVRITMMVKPSAADLVCNNPVIDDVIIFDYKAKENSWQSMLRYAKEIRKRQFDASISLDRKLRPAIVTWLAGIPVRIGPDRVFDDKKSLVTLLFTDVIHTPDDFLHTHQADIFQSIIRGFFRCEGSVRPVLATVSKKYHQKANELLAEMPLRDFKIALCVKGTYYLKNWPQEKFSQLIKILYKKYNAAFFIVGAPEDREYADEIISATSGIEIANFCGRTTLLDLAALMHQTDVFITIDTGAMHIAATTGVPIVGIFRCVSTARWHPLVEKCSVVDIRWPGCPTSGPPENCPHLECVKDIEVDAIVAEVHKQLSYRIGEKI